MQLFCNTIPNVHLAFHVYLGQRETLWVLAADELSLHVQLLAEAAKSCPLLSTTPLRPCTPLFPLPARTA